MAVERSEHPAKRYVRRVISGELLTCELVRLAVERHQRDLGRQEEENYPYYFDEPAAQRVIDFFQFCNHVEGKWAGEPIELEDWQQFALWVPFGWKRKASGLRRFRRAYIEVARKNGKGLALDTPIPTPSGWTTMGQLTPGDEVFDERGYPCRVQWVSDDHHLDCYEFRFSDGERVVCDGEHLWKTRVQVNSSVRIGREMSAKGESVRDPRPREARQIYETQRYGKRDDVNHSIELQWPLSLPDKQLPIPPYLLGAWLGDGCKDSVSISVGNEDFAHLVSKLESLQFGVVTRRDKTAWRVSPFAKRDGNRVGIRDRDNLQGLLRRCGLIGNKHIPPDYLRGSFRQRLELLQGLLDTDGTISKSGRNIVFTTISPKLRDGVRELLSSFGVKSTIRAKPMVCNGRPLGRDAYSIQFHAFRDELEVFTLPRKLQRMLYREKTTVTPRSKSLQVVEVVSVPTVTTRCIAVDSPSRMFLCGKTMIPTHNSSWTAGLGLYFLIADGEAGGQVYSAATTRDQAKIIHGAAAKMVKVSPFLSRSVQVFRNNISVPETFSKFEPLSADFNTLDGLSPSAGLIDEIHAHKNRGVVDVIETGMGARQQPMMWMITTAGINTADSIALEFRNHGEQVLKGIRDDEVYFPLIYTQDESDNWLDENLWIKSNPNLGVSVNIEELRELALKAKEIPAAQNNFKTKRLNIWCNSRSRWIPVERWDACREDYTVQELLGKECYAGLDLSTTTDISALALVFPWDDGKYRVLPFYWVPLENADLRARRDRVPYPLWIEQGHIFGTPGNAIDYGFIRKKIVELSSLYKMREIAADPWNATQILQQLQEEDGLPVVEMRQGFASMSSPMKSLEALIMSQRLRHRGCPVMRWMMDNVSVRMDPAGNMKPDKEKSAERIDGVVAMVMGVGRAELRKAPVSNPYESGGVFSL